MPATCARRAPRVAAAGTTLRASPARTTVGSSVTGAELRVLGAEVGAGERDEVARQGDGGVRRVQRARMRRVGGAAPRDVSSSTSSPFCATARSSPVGSPKTAAAIVTPSAAR
jgi:hypothetical protein